MLPQQQQQEQQQEQQAKYRTDSYKLSWYINSLLVTLIVVGLLVCFFILDPWVHKVCIYYTMKINFFSVTMGPGGIGGAVSLVLSDKMKAKLAMFFVERTFDFDAFHSWVCQIPPGPWPYPCTLFDQLKIAIYVLLVTTFFGFVSMVGGWMSEWSYVTHPKTSARTTCRILYGLAPLFFVCGMLPYWWTASHMSDLVPQGDVDVLERGFWIALLLMLVSPALLVVNMVFAVDNEKELENEIQSIHNRNEREQQLNLWRDQQLYGTPGQPYGNYGAAPPPMASLPVAGSSMVGGARPMVTLPPMQPQYGGPAW